MKEAKRERKEFRFMMESSLCIFLKFCISCSLPLGKVTTMWQGANESLLFLSFFFFLISQWWINMSAFQYRLSVFFPAHLFYSSESVTGVSYYSPIWSPSASRLAVAQPGRTSFLGEIKLIDFLMSCDFNCHKSQAAKSTSITTRGALSGFGEFTKTGPATESLQEFAPGGESGRVLITCPSRPRAVC